MNKKLHVLLTPTDAETIDLTIEISESGGMFPTIETSFTAPANISESKEALTALIQQTYDTMEMLTDDEIDIEVLIPEEVKYDEVLDILVTALAVLQST